MARRVFPVLEHKMREKKITRTDIACLLGRSERTVHEKMSGERKFTLQEAFMIRDGLFPLESLDDLFGNPGPF